MENDSAAWRQTLRRELRAAGFAGSGDRFRRPLGQNWLIAQLTRAPDAPEVTVDLGIWSPRLGDPSVVPSRATLRHCQRVVRIGGLVSDEDKWWSIVDSQRAATEITVSLQAATEALAEFGTDEGLRDVWLRDAREVGLSMEEAAWLRTLLARLGPRELLPLADAAVERRRRSVAAASQALLGGLAGFGMDLADTATGKQVQPRQDLASLPGMEEAHRRLDRAAKNSRQKLHRGERS